MNYKESKKILKLINQSKKILLNCHFVPDADSIASACALKFVLEQLNKKVQIICTSEVSEKFHHIKGANSIVLIDNINTFDFSKFDLMIITDSEGWKRINKDSRPKDLKKVINIDHHPKNTIEGEVNVIDIKATSTCEIIYLILEDLNFEISKELATTLFTGIATDTRFFQNQNASSRGYLVASRLLDQGADNYGVYLNTEANYEENALRLWGEFLANFKVDHKYNFVWSAIPEKIYKKYPVKQSITSSTIDIIFKKLEKIDFAILMCEKENGAMSLSFRSRTFDYDVASMARELGGGGHRVAAGGFIEGLEFEEAIKKVLNTARKYAKAYKKAS